MKKGTFTEMLAQVLNPHSPCDFLDRCYPLTELDSSWKVIAESSDLVLRRLCAWMQMARDEHKLNEELYKGEKLVNEKAVQWMHDTTSVNIRMKIIFHLFRHRVLELFSERTWGYKMIYNLFLHPNSPEIFFVAEKKNEKVETV